jgi:hypothetical protein
LTGLVLTDQRPHDARVTNMQNTIVQIRVGLNTFLRIPESWDRFVYRDFLYVRGADGRFVVRGRAA